MGIPVTKLYRYNKWSQTVLFPERGKPFPCACAFRKTGSRDYRLGTECKSVMKSFVVLFVVLFVVFLCLCTSCVVYCSSSSSGSSSSGSDNNEDGGGGGGTSTYTIPMCHPDCFYCPLTNSCVSRTLRCTDSNFNLQCQQKTYDHCNYNPESGMCMHTFNTTER